MTTSADSADPGATNALPLPGRRPPVPGCPVRRRMRRWAFVMAGLYVAGYATLRATRTLQFQQVCTTGLMYARVEHAPAWLGEAAEYLFWPGALAEWRLRAARGEVKKGDWLVESDLFCRHGSGEGLPYAQYRRGVRICAKREWER